MIDIGLTHIALPVSNVERSIEFYSTYAAMQVVNRQNTFINDCVNSQLSGSSRV